MIQIQIEFEEVWLSHYWLAYSIVYRKALQAGSPGKNQVGPDRKKYSLLKDKYFWEDSSIHYLCSKIFEYAE